MSVSWRIRKAIKDDAEAIIKLLQDMIGYHEMLHKYKGVSLEEFQEDCFGPTPWVHCIVAESCEDTNENIIAYGSYYYEYKPRKGRSLYMIDLFVVPSKRGKGLGKALLKEISKIALSNSCTSIHWDIDPDNTRAMDFYKRLGAREDYGIAFMNITDDNVTKLTK